MAAVGKVSVALVGRVAQSLADANTAASDAQAAGDMSAAGLARERADELQATLLCLHRMRTDDLVKAYKARGGRRAGAGRPAGQGVGQC